MPRIVPTALPADALLRRYLDNGSYTDCYSTTLPRHVPHADFVAAFYTTPLFKCERLILKWLVGRPSTDAEAAQLGVGTRDRFAAWQVEDRSAVQLLLCDFTGRTRSWLMSVPIPSDATAGARGCTRLYFGSAVVAKSSPGTIQADRKSGFSLLLGFHRLYSRLLLGAACRRLLSKQPRIGASISD